MRRGHLAAMFAIVLTVCVLLPAIGARADTGLVDWWAAEGNALDSAGTNNGTLSNVTFAPGAVGQAFSFNGGSSSVGFGTTAGNFGTSDFTIQFWIQTTGTSSVGVLGKRPVCSHSSMVDIRMSGSGTLQIELDQDSSGSNFNTFFTTKSVNNGAYHLVTYVRQGATVTAYIDGAVDSSHASSSVINLSNSTTLTVGRSTCTGLDGTGWFAGQLDEIKLYTRALSSGEIASYYASPSGGTATPELGSGALLVGGLIPIALILISRRRRGRRSTL